MNFFVLLVVLGVAAAHAKSIDLHRLRRSTLIAKLNDAMEQKIRSVAEGDAELENALNEYKRSYVRAFDETLKDNFRQVREVLTDRRRSVDTEDAAMNVKRAFDTMEDRVHQKAERDLVTRDFASFWNKVKEGAGKLKDKVKEGAGKLKDQVKEGAGKVKNWAKGKFGTFKDFAKEFVSNVYEDVKPDLMKIKDMAVELINTQAKDLSEEAKEQASSFFEKHSKALTDDDKKGISKVLKN